MTKKHLVTSQLIIISIALLIPFLLYIFGDMLALGIGGNLESRASDEQIMNIMQFLSPSPNRDSVECKLTTNFRSQNPQKWANCDKLEADATSKDELQNEFRAIYFYIFISLIYYGTFFIRNRKISSELS